MTRLERLRAALGAAGVDALWISDPANVRYVSGFTAGKDGKVLVTPAGATLYTDARYTVQAAEESGLPQFIARPPETYQHAADAVRGLRVGVEAESLTLSGLEELREHWPGAELVPVSGLGRDLRLRKEPGELDPMREAARVADAAFGEVRPRIVPGARELDIALELELAMRRMGAQSAFEIIVASGPNGAKPHGVASGRIIQDGELVTVDMGAALGGYHSDMTRTVAVGEIGEEVRRLYRAVLEAQQAAVEAVRPGVRAGDLDGLARDILDGHGLADYFAHSLGHGIGLEVHEGPSLRGVTDDLLEAGMVVTIEPGVYVPGVGGVRIEDMVLVTDGGGEVLTHAPKDDL